jgi:signal peptide peptidase SppA
MHYELAQLFSTSRWLIEPRALRALVHQAGLATPESIHAAMVAYGQRPMEPTVIGDVAVIEVNGPITYKSSWLSMFFGGASIQDLQQQFRMALGDQAVRTIAFKFDSPGGVIDMVPEFADEIYKARGTKTMVAIADTMIASAAYWLAAQVDTIYATTSSQLGSIGVYNEHEDLSGMLEKAGVKITLIAHGDHKVDGNPYEPLSDEARAARQAGVDEVGEWFDAAVARGRGVKKSVVLDTFGQGQVFRGKEAIALGLADRVGTFSDVLLKLTKGRGGMSSPRAAVIGGGGGSGVLAGPHQCAGCSRSMCDCPEPECDPECPTCKETCSCRQAEADPKPASAAAARAVPGAASADLADIDDEHAAILAALSAL